MFHMKRGFAVSDLHLFAHRSSAHDHLPLVRQAATEADFIVLNGDIFDFRWSTLPTRGHTLDAAVGWLRSLAEDHPECRFYYIMGNHDALAPLAPRLDALVAERPNLHWNPTHVRINDALFLHGDLPLHRKRRSPFARDLVTSEVQWGRLASFAYHVFVHLHLHRLVSLIHWPQRCARRILRSLADHGRELADGITDVYFGHTHEPFRDFHYRGIRFHNSGAAVRGLQPVLLPVRV
jgi:UDP-2,3-diacylglucosamine pyrophosphatase LpxH